MLTGLLVGASWCFLATVCHGGPSGDPGPQMRVRYLAGKLQLPWSSTTSEYEELKYLPFLSTFLQIRKIFTENSHVLSNSIYRQTNIKYIERKFPARPCCLLLLCKFIGEGSAMINSPSGVGFSGLFGLYMSADSYILHCNLPIYNRSTAIVCSTSSHSYFHNPLLQILHSASVPFDVHILFN